MPLQQKLVVDQVAKKIVACVSGYHLDCLLSSASLLFDYGNKKGGFAFLGKGCYRISPCYQVLGFKDSQIYPG